MEEGDPNAVIPAQQLVNEEGLPINPEPVVEAEPEKIPPEILQDMRQVWSVFALGDQDQVPMSDLRTILRAMDQDLNAEELEEIKAQIDPEKKVISFAKLKLVMEDRLKPKGTVEELTALFKTLDMNEDGTIPAPEFKNYMLNLGQKLPLEEYEALWKEAGNDKEIDIAALAERLCPQPPPPKKGKKKKKK